MSEAQRIAAALEGASLPDWVERTTVEPMVDHTGEASLRVIVFVRHGREEMFRDGRALNQLARRILETAVAAGSELYTYTRFLAARDAA